MLNFIKYFIQGVVTALFVCIMCLGLVVCSIIELCFRGRLKKSEQTHPLMDMWAHWWDNLYDVLNKVGLLAEDF